MTDRSVRTARRPQGRRHGDLAPTSDSPGHVATPRGPNAERHQRSRAALLRAARKVFARDGFAAARTSDVVDSAVLTRGALYYHFPDKLALFDAVVEEVAKEIAARIEAAAQPAPTALMKLRRGCEEWIDAMDDPPLRRLYLVDGMAALGVRRWREIDMAYGGNSLRGGVETVLAEHGDHALEVEPLVALLSGALNEAALWVAEAQDGRAARNAIRASLDVLLTRLFKPSGHPK